MDASIWVDLLDNTIPLFLFVALGLTFYQGFKKNHSLLSDREDLLKRYLIFRGDKQVLFKTLTEKDQAYQDVRKTISNSWKNFKKTYDQYLTSFARNTARTKLFLQIITLGFILNSARLVLADLLMGNSSRHLAYTVLSELPSYVLVILCFLVLRIQAHRVLLPKVKAVEMDREILFFPNGRPEGEDRRHYDEFDPLEVTGGEDGEEHQNPDSGSHP